MFKMFLSEHYVNIGFLLAVGIVGVVLLVRFVGMVLEVLWMVEVVGLVGVVAWSGWLRFWAIGRKEGLFSLSIKSNDFCRS